MANAVLHSRRSLSSKAPHLPVSSSLLLAAVLAARVLANDAAPTNSCPVLAPFELRDQYNAAHRVSFPASNVTVMTVADKKGSEQIDGWVAPLKTRYSSRIAITGLADVSTVPSPLRSLVREKFKRRIAYPVILDWHGPVARQFNYLKDRANVFVIDREGRVTGRWAGAATEADLHALFAAVDLALSTPPAAASKP